MKKLLLIGAVLLVLLAGAFALLNSGKSAPPAMPNPNGYDDLIKAGQSMQKVPDHPEHLDAELLRQWVTNNAEALHLARSALTKEIRSVLDESPSMQKGTQWLTGLKNVALGMVAEGQLLEKLGKTNEAALLYRDGVLLGAKSSRGSIVIGSLIAQAMESIHLRYLEQAVERVDGATARELVRGLREADTARETPEQVLKNEAEWASRVWGFKGKLMRAVTASSHKKMEESFREKAAELRQQNRLLTIRCALRAYEADKGRAPAKLSELVPEYMPAIPEANLQGVPWIPGQ